MSLSLSFFATRFFGAVLRSWRWLCHFVRDLCNAKNDRKAKRCKTTTKFLCVPYLKKKQNLGKERYRINSHKSHTLKAASAALALHKRPLVSYLTSAISKSAGAQFSNNTRTRVYRTQPHHHHLKFESSSASVICGNCTKWLRAGSLSTNWCFS